MTENILDEVKKDSTFWGEAGAIAKITLLCVLVGLGIVAGERVGDYFWPEATRTIKVEHVYL